MRKNKEGVMQELPVIFEGKSIRRGFENGEWFYAVIDVIASLTESNDPAAYWRKLKQRLKSEGSETVTKCHGLKLTAADGKKRLTDVLNSEGILRLIQSIPSSKAEPFKQWMAKVGVERLKEERNPELAVNRAVKTWKRQGQSKEWINTRLKGIEKRNALTDYWHNHGIEKSKDYAALTNVVHREWSGMTVKEHKEFKGLKRENLRDHMTAIELSLADLAETVALTVAEERSATGFKENAEAAREGGGVARVAREDVERRLGRTVISRQNNLAAINA